MSGVFPGHRVEAEWSGEGMDEHTKLTQDANKVKQGELIW
jgi:hypothetical protein